MISIHFLHLLCYYALQLAFLVFGDSNYGRHIKMYDIFLL